jgi:hypothetical protein
MMKQVHDMATLLVRAIGGQEWQTTAIDAAFFTPLSTESSQGSFRRLDYDADEL